MAVVYDFRSVPTIKQFFKSRKRIKCIMGPVGCVSGDTEYLTKNGWRRISNFNETDKIAVFDPKVNRVFFDYPLDYIEKDYDTFMHIYKKNMSLSMCLTPEHTILYLDNQKRFRKTTTVELYKKIGYKYIPTALFMANTTVNIDEINFRKNIIKFLRGFDIEKKGFKVSSRREEVVRRAISLFDAKVIEKKGNNTIMFIPCEIDFTFNYDLSTRLAVWGLDELLIWSGYDTDKHGTKVWTARKQKADYMQYLAHSNGVHTTICKTGNSLYLYFHLKRNKLSPVIRNDAVIMDIVSHYKKKYCFTTKTGFFVARHRNSIFITGNSGKSSGCVISLLHYMSQQSPNERGVRNTRFAIIRNTVKELKDTTKNTIEDWVQSFKPIWRESENKYIFKFGLDDGTIVKSEWLLRALDRPDQIKDLLSLELSGAWLNEAREIMKDVFDMLDGRIGRFPRGCTYPFILMDTNPPDTDSWLYKYFEEQLPNDPLLQDKAQLWKQPSGLSPEAENIPNLPPKYYENLAIGKDADFIKVYVHGEYGTVRTGKVVFPSFNHSVHVAKEELKPVRGLQLIIGMDFGLTPAVVITQFLPGGRMFVYDEIVTEESVTMSLQELLQFRLLPLLNSEKYFGMSCLIIGDPAGRNRSQLDKTNCFMVLRQFNFQAYPAYTNSITARIDAVNSFLNRMVDGKPAFQVSPTCKTLIKGMTSKYVFRRIKTFGEKYTDLPDKNEYSHVCDALQYAAMGYNPSFTKQHTVEQDNSFSLNSGGTTTPTLSLI